MVVLKKSAAAADEECESLTLEVEQLREKVFALEQDSDGVHQECASLTSEVQQLRAKVWGPGGPRSADQYSPPAPQLVAHSKGIRFRAKETDTPAIETTKKGHVRACGGGILCVFGEHAQTGIGLPQAHTGTNSHCQKASTAGKGSGSGRC